MPPNIAYIHSPELEHLGNIGTHPAGRSERVHRLVESLGLLRTDLPKGRPVEGYEASVADVVAAIPATKADLQRYHTQSFVDFLLNSGKEDFAATQDHSDSAGSSSDESPSNSSFESSQDSRPRKRQRGRQTLAEKFGLQDDCPPFPELASYARWIAGSTLTAARLLVSRPASEDGDAQDYDAVINWEGGRHHALRDRCSGFCYVQDVVLGIDHLRRHGQPAASISTPRKPRIMYLDLDVHLGDAPAAAFKHPYRYSSPITASQKRQPKPTVLTVSVHHQSPGFFPSTPEADLTLSSTSTPCTVSIPLRRAASAPTYAHIWNTCIEPLRAAFEPDYVVLLLGMNALAGDALVDGAANWSTSGVGGVDWCIEQAMKWDTRMLVLGGGGYHRANTARGWAIVTSRLLDRPVPEDVPSHDFWPEYAPSFQMHVESSAAKDENDPAYLAHVQREIAGVAERIREIFSS